MRPSISPRSHWRHMFASARASHAPVLLLTLLLTLISGVAVPAFSFLLGLVFNTFSEHGSGQIDRVQRKANVDRNIEYLVALGVLDLFSHGEFYAAWVLFGEF